MTDWSFLKSYHSFMWFAVFAYGTVELGNLKPVHRRLRQLWRKRLGKAAMSVAIVPLALGYWQIALLLTPAESPEPGQNDEQLLRLNVLLDEGVRLSGMCQRVPNIYQVPPEARPDLVHSIHDWQQRVEAFLVLDPDPHVVQIWRESILFLNPKAKSTLATRCTSLAVKLEGLRRVINKKTTTPIQLDARLQSLIDEGESLKAFALTSANERDISEREIAWTIRVYDWLGDHFDESRQKELNSAGVSAAYPSQRSTTPVGIDVWRRNEGRLEVLRRLQKELRVTRRQ